MSVDFALERVRHPEVFRGKGWLRWVLLTGVFAYLFYLMWLFDFVRGVPIADERRCLRPPG